MALNKTVNELLQRNYNTLSQEHKDIIDNYKAEQEIYAKIKEIKDEIEFTKNNGYDYIKNQKYIQELEQELQEQYKTLEMFEKMYNLLDNDKTSVDDYLDRASAINKLDEYNY